MKRRYIFLAVAAAAALMLTACSSFDSTSSQSTGSSTAGQGTAGSDSGSTAGQGTTGSDLGSTAGQGTADNGSGSSAGGAQDTIVTGGAEEGEPDGEIIPDEYAQEAEQDASSDAWSGSYISDEESVSIALLDESTISFSFAQSGISGTASVNGMQAVYNGDDHYVVVFNLNGDLLDVSVSNEEDYDASGSPLNGTYSRG